MGPQKFSSVRYRARPAALAAFRDDSSLVGLRYEQTVQAEPPIPIPGRNPLRSTAVRPFSSVSSPPVVVVAPPLAPPTEEHPALRSPSAERRRAYDNWKRDSGLAPTTSSATIHEEDCEDELLYDKILELADQAIVAPVVRQAREPVDVVVDDSSSSIYSSDDNGLCTSPPPTTPEFSRPATSHQAAPDTPSSRTLAKSFSFRSGTSKRLRKRSLSASDDSSDLRSSAAAAMQAQHASTPPPQGSTTPTKAPTKSRSIAWFRTGKSNNAPPEPDFSPISTPIPTDSLLDDDFYATLNFSKRGSIMFGSDQDLSINMGGAAEGQQEPDNAGASSTQPSQSMNDTASSATLADVRDAAPERPSRGLLALPNIRLLSADVENESQKVRSLYEPGGVLRWEDGGRALSVAGGDRLEPTPEVPSEENEDDPTSEPPTQASDTQRSADFSSSPRDNPVRKPFELAGGLEDWEDVDGGDVDRYGFISARRPESRVSTPTGLETSQLSSRRKNVLTKRDPSGLTVPGGGSHGPGRKVSARSLNTQASEMSTASRRSTRSAIRQAGNLLPYNRDRRWMDEAGDMLTLAPGLSDIIEDPNADKISEELKRKEWERSEKWRKMAKVVKKGKDGEGMEFEFDVTNPKVIERTWKGIPDRWRASAWYSFLAASARGHAGAATEEEIMADFRRLQDESSPDDVQIDLDVPRTINRHIMFRRRYRGGQRLLFRVLHAVSLYFPDTGYVQGMAALAATLLCYFDEERCFVVLVRMWQFRGLEQLYRPGFEGLMAALREFETRWLEEKDVAKKLSELNIDATAYGTRWYLTLFNLSIPFPAQLRVWDVFLLLGDSNPEASIGAAGGAAETGAASSSSVPTQAVASAPAVGPSTSAASGTLTDLDVLHATSAALIHALREVLLDSDFENAMKALTSWIPVKDEELLMKVARAEWKLHQGRKKS